MVSPERATLIFRGLVVTLLTAILFLVAHSGSRRPPDRRFNTPYQAVLLDNGQVYYGKLEGRGTEYPILTDVFYVQSSVNPQTKQVSNVLVRRGKEWHEPDKMIINARHILLIEPVGPASKVAELIAEQKEQK